MTAANLERELERAPTNDAVVAALARYFDAHGLVFGHGTDNASDEAFWLVRHVQGWREGLWHARPDAALTPRLAALAERRVRERRPLAYVVGEAWFAGLKFEVDERVIVPRSPLAELVETGFEPWCALERGDRVLDVGTGSGAIAVACAVHSPGVHVDATDVSSDALAVAARNVELHGVEQRVRLHEADLLPPGATRYRVIVSNPPYVPSRDIETFPPEYGHEPALALDGGATGLELPLKLMRAAAARLTDDGVLVLEVGEGAAALAEQCAGLPMIQVELERGGEGVLTIGAADLAAYFGADFSGRRA